MQPTSKSIYQNKYSLGKLGLISGFLCFFGLYETGYKKHQKYLLYRSDSDALRSDWNTVGQDFSKVIEKERLTNAS